MAFCCRGTEEREEGNWREGKTQLNHLWSQDKLDRSILRVLEGDDGEETLLSGTSDTLCVTLSLRPGDTKTVSYRSRPLFHSSSLFLLHISSLCLFHSSSLCLTILISCSTSDWLLSERSLKKGFDVKVLSCGSTDSGVELRQNSDALRMIRLEVSTTMTLAEGTASEFAGQSERPPIAEESRRFLEAGLEESGSRMMTLLAVISW